MVEAVNVGESGGVGRWYSKGKAAAWGGGQGCSLGRRARLQAELDRGWHTKRSGGFR